MTICALLRVRSCRVLMPVKFCADIFEVFTEFCATRLSELIEEGTVIGSVKVSSVLPKALWIRTPFPKSTEFIVLRVAPFAVSERIVPAVQLEFAEMLL